MTPEERRADFIDRLLRRFPDVPIAAVDFILAEAIQQISDHQRKGREWIQGSLWDKLTAEAAVRIKELMEPPHG